MFIAIHLALTLFSYAYISATVIVIVGQFPYIKSPPEVLRLGMPVWTVASRAPPLPRCPIARLIAETDVVAASWSSYILIHSKSSVQQSGVVWLR